MHPISLLSRPEMEIQTLPPAADGSGALINGRLDSLSGRPSCRIYPVGRGWGLEIERSSAWLSGFDLPGNFRFFRSLAAAVAFAEAHGFDYRVVRPTAFFVGTRRRSAVGRQQRRRQHS